MKGEFSMEENNRNVGEGVFWGLGPFGFAPNMGLRIWICISRIKSVFEFRS